MSGEGRWVLVATGAVAVLLLALFAFLAASGPSAAPDPEPRPTPRPAYDPGPARPAPRAVRVPLPAPPERRHPDPTDRMPPVRIDSDTKLAMNRAVDDVVRPASEQCLKPWLDGQADPRPSEMVFDVVLHDGELADVGLRSLQADLPADVVSCVADVVWSGDWPTFEGAGGELRLQRTFTVEPSP